ncbi:hypothetical protein ABRY23_05250 [Melioribacteraceae bacterium 4301-Me]|uniref:hypothetical protein n=1 Tax=Pyranulibacter aquaticus TaxID=3163344 RepID=UPI003594F801
MRRLISYSIVLMLFVLIVFSASGCKNEDSVVAPNGNTNLQQALEKITNNDQSVQSFEDNYNEEQAMSLAKTQLAKELYPIKIGQRMELANRQLTIDYGDSTAVGTLTSTYNGKLFILAAFNSSTTTRSGYPLPDTLVTKSFTTIITRKIQYVKVDNTGDNLIDWKISAISLPQGGTENSGVTIKTLTLINPDGSVLVIDSPNNFFFDKGPRSENNNYSGGNNSNNGQSGNMMGQNGHMGNGNNQFGLSHRVMFPIFGMNQPVKVQVELESAYADTDLVTITHGAMLGGLGREKAKLNLISETNNGGTYTRVFEGKWFTNMHGGYMHAVLNALPHKSVYDSDASVEENTWGVPYLVR